LARDLDRIGAEVRAQNVGQPREAARRARERGRPGDGRALLAREREGDVLPAHSKAPHHVADRLRLAALALEKLEPRRRRIEQVAYLDACAVAERGGFLLRLGAAIDRDRPGMRLVLVPRGDQKVADRAN